MVGRRFFTKGNYSATQRPPPTFRCIVLLQIWLALKDKKTRQRALHIIWLIVIIYSIQEVVIL
jgi:hypothetical protein